MPFIKKEFIERLLDRVDIVDVIGSRIKLKKSGSSYMALCPFHHEKSASFSVNQAKQFFNCFGCHKAGNAIKFVMDFDHVDFLEAVQELAKSVGMNVEYDDGVHLDDGRKKNLYDLLDDAVSLYEAELPRHNDALDYLHKRGLSDETIHRYHMGFAPEGWDFLRSRLAGSDKNRVEMLLNLGLLSTGQEGGHTYDTFRKRIMIPIRDRRGRTIAFGGRVLDDSKPKYINSKESSVYKKGCELFNLDQVRKIVDKDLEFIMITEGYMDVIALEQYGIHNAVAALGTATTARQMDLLFRQSDKIVFCYDGDSAGRHAAWHALSTALPALRDDKQLNFCFLPPEHDPDSFVRANGSESMMEYMRHAEPLTDYVVSMLGEKYNVDDEGGKINCLNEAGQIYQLMVDAPIMRTSLVSAMSRLVEWPEERILKSMLSVKPVNQRNDETSEQNSALSDDLHQERKELQNIKMTVMRTLVAHILQDPFLVKGIPDCDTLVQILGQFKESRMDIVLELLSKISLKPDIKTGSLVEQYRGTKCEDLINYLAAVDLGSDELTVEVKLIDLLKFVKKLLIEGIVEARLQSLKEKTRNNSKLSADELAEAMFLERKIRSSVESK